MKKSTAPEQARFNAIMNSRNEVTLGHAGKVIRARISGTPNLGYWDDRIVNPSTGEVGALKDLYSFNVSKGTVLDSPWFANAHAEACALEEAGHADEARALFNDLMNKSQLSFGIINRDGSKQQFASGQIVDIALDTTTVEDKDDAGNPTGTSHIALIVSSISPVQATVIGKGRKFGADVTEAAPAIPVGAAVPAQ
jgi:hypothetical protein